MRQFTKKLLTDKGLTVSGIAREAAVRRSTIQRLLKQKTLPSYETREALQRIVGEPLKFSKKAA